MILKADENEFAAPTLDACSDELGTSYRYVDVFECVHFGLRMLRSSRRASTVSISRKSKIHALALFLSFLPT